jgi:hypothetical protein
MRNNAHYSVSPRHSCGSPARVDEATAIHVAEQEVREYRCALEGHYGSEKKLEAERAGLDGIVVLMFDKRNHWEAHDVITGKVYVWPFEPKCPKCGRKVHADRGVLQEHTWMGSYRVFECDAAGQYVGMTYEAQAAIERGLHPRFSGLV